MRQHPAGWAGLGIHERGLKGGLLAVAAGRLDGPCLPKEGQGGIGLASLRGDAHPHPLVARGVGSNRSHTKELLAGMSQ